MPLPYNGLKVGDEVTWMFTTFYAPSNGKVVGLLDGMYERWVYVQWNLSQRITTELALNLRRVQDLEVTHG